LKAIFLLLVFLFPVFLFSQLPQHDSAAVIRDSLAIAKNTAGVKIDSLAVKADSVVKASAALSTSYQSIIERVLADSRYLNASGKPAATFSKEMPPLFNDTLFYLLLGLVLLLAFLRFFYERYFNNLFRVFFNTSLRQSQLTDQLLQAKQVSLFFNVLFAITGGLYVYFLLSYFNWVNAGNSMATLGICILTMSVIYFLKYLTLKFTGWLTGFREAANTYLFIIFLINKILGILLIPFVIVIAFAANFLQYPAIIVSLLLIGLMFLLRFLRSYGLLRKDIKVSRLHFFLYIAGIEVIPLLLIYKLLMILLNKNI
jgi:hypothetical protein